MLIRSTSSSWQCTSDDTAKLRKAHRGCAAIKHAGPTPLGKFGLVKRARGSESSYILVTQSSRVEFERRGKRERECIITELFLFLSLLASLPGETVHEPGVCPAPRSGPVNRPVSPPASFPRVSSLVPSISLRLLSRQSEAKERERDHRKRERTWGPPTVWWADASLQQSAERRDRCLPPRTIARSSFLLASASPRCASACSNDRNFG